MVLMSWPSEEQLADLVARFETGTVSASEFTHAAHLVIGLWHARTFDRAEALSRMRAGILRLNHAHGTPNTDARGYHETITRAYLILLAQYSDGDADLDCATLARELLDAPLAGRDLLSRFYSRDVLTSVKARREWVEPDIRPLDVRSLTAPQSRAVQTDWRPKSL